MEKALWVIDKYLGWLYTNMFKVITDSGDFIQGLKRLLTKEMDSIVNLIFDFGLKVCLAFIALDVVILFTGRELSSISIYSKVLSLLLILGYKYNVQKHIKSLSKFRKSNQS